MVYSVGYSGVVVTRVVGTTEAAILAPIEIQDLRFSTMCAFGKWRCMHVVTDDYSSKRRMRKFPEAEAVGREMLSLRNLVLLLLFRKVAYILFP